MKKMARFKNFEMTKYPKIPAKKHYIKEVIETSHWRPNGEIVQVGATHVLEEFGFAWLKTLELCNSML